MSHSLSRLALVAAAIAVCAAPAEGQRRITGHVTEQATGAPVAGATVTVTGTTLAASTTDAGTFSLARVPGGVVTLVVRRIGFARRTTVLSPIDSVADVSLVRDALQLEQVVITGAATAVERRNAANDVAQVSADQLAAVPAPSVENALAGRIAGAQVVANSGAPGGGNQIRLRGVTSVFGSADPLYVVDGVIVSNDAIQSGINAISAAARASSNASNQDNGVNRIADLNPNDIESIDILKGASASAIYGSKASNGVIVIRTKRGSVGSPTAELVQRLGTRRLANKFGERRFSLEEARAVGAANGLSQSAVDANYASCNGYCDFEDQLFGEKPLNFETNLSVRGGSTTGTTYFASLLALNDGGIQQNTGYQKQAGRLNLGQSLASRVNVQLGATVMHTLTRRGISNNDNANITPYFVFAGTPSWVDLRPRDGVFPRNPFVLTNPLQNAALIRTPEDVYRIVGSGTMTVNLLARPTQTLDFRGDVGLDRFNQNDNVVSPRTLFWEPNDGLPGTVTSLSGNVVYGNANASAIHTWTPTGRGLRATTSLGLQREVSARRSTNIVTRDVVAGQENVNRGAATEVFADHQAVRGLALYAQEELLALDEKLFLSAGVRAERSTVNGDIKKFYAFPKGAVSYRFARPIPRVDEIKLRAAIGQSGNQPLYIQKYSPALAGTYTGQNTLQPGLTNGNPDIRPERQTEIEGGFDAELFGGRGSLSLTAYQKTIHDVILQVVTAPSLGYSVDIRNGGSIRNRGTEAVLALTPLQYRSASWLTRFTFSRNVGIVTALPAGISAFNVERDASGQRVAFGAGYGIGRLEVGKRVTQIVASGCNGACVEQKGDGAPRFILGATNTVTLGRFSASALAEWQPGASLVNITQNVYDGGGLAPDQPDGGIARARRNDVEGNSQYVQKASFAKLREVTIAYELSPSLTRRATGSLAKRLRIEAAGRNLVTWTDYLGVDPEVSNFGSQQISRFIDLAPFPPSRSFYLTLAASF